MIAIAYLDGESVHTLSDRYGIPQSTIYYWLDRFERTSIEEAVADASRSGRPPKLTPDQLSVVEEILSKSPDDHGYEGKSWTAEKVQQLIAERFDIEYSTGHLRRLLKNEFNKSGI
jgi:transposase